MCLGLTEQINRDIIYHCKTYLRREATMSKKKSKSNGKLNNLTKSKAKSPQTKAKNPNMFRHQGR
jgi:hypothetical protein